jgi:hypothetical protein
MPTSKKSKSSRRSKKSKKNLIIMSKEDIGMLTKYGYHLANSFEDRIKSLKKALKHTSHLTVLKRVNAIRTLHKSHPIYYNKLDKDMKWLQKYYKENK